LKETRAIKEVTTYKNIIIKETMLSLEGAALQSAHQKYFDYVADARLDRSEPIERDEQAQAEIASDLSEALDDTLHDHTDKLNKLREVDFGPQSAVTEGALLTLAALATGVAVPADAKQRHREIAGFFDQRAERAWADGSVAHCVYSGGPKGAYCWPTSPE
jgi:hypothetical protein